MIEILDDDLCDGCGICFDICPCDVFRIEPESGHAWIAYRDDCQTCFLCELDCKPHAIFVGPVRKERVQAWVSP